MSQFAASASAALRSPRLFGLQAMLNAAFASGSVSAGLLNLCAVAALSVGRPISRGVADA